MDILSAIKELTKTNYKTIIPAVVDKVDKENRTVDCRPLFEDAPLLDVNIQACQGGKKGGICLYPKVGSHVVVALFDNSGRGCVILTEEIEQVLIENGSTMVEITDKGITLNGGYNHGMVKVEALTKRLNEIENEINSLKKIFSSWVVAPQDGGSALKGALASWMSNSIKTTDQKDLENDKIKH